MHLLILGAARGPGPVLRRALLMICLFNEDVLLPHMGSTGKAILMELQVAYVFGSSENVS
jgi:hypothetical protein